MFFLYTILYRIVLLFILPFEYIKRPAEIRKKWIREKFGFFDSSLFTPHAQLLWIHAVSVGEVIAALPLLRKLREQYPSCTILLSTITDTGQKVARERAPKGTWVIYLPFDIPSVLERALNTLNPGTLIILETELWPNLLRACASRKIPVLLLNGRISENSYRGYRKVAFFMKKVLACVDFFGMQNEEYAARIRSLGVEQRRVGNLGNFKFDAVLPHEPPAWTDRISHPVLVAGSTSEGEEGMITSAYLELKNDFPGLTLVLAPRHPERFAEVGNFLKNGGIPLLKYSELSALNSQPGTLKGVILLDTVGELSGVYGAGDIAIIGKSFMGRGGQNPLEPAAWGKPILCGPHMENFPVIREFYEAGAALEVSPVNLPAAIRELLMNPEKADALGSRAREVYRKNSGAVERAMEVLAKYLEQC